MKVMARFQFHFLQNACIQLRMAPGCMFLCHIDTFLVTEMSEMFLLWPFTKITKIVPLCWTKWLPELKIKKKKKKKNLWTTSPPRPVAQLQNDFTNMFLKC